MIFIPFVLFVLLVVWLRHRRHRKSELGGLSSEKPVFSVAPPTRRLGDRRRERL